MKLRFGWLLVVGLCLAHDNDEAMVEDVNSEDVVQVETVEVEDVAYFTPESHPDHFLAEHFDDPSVLGSRWIKSQAMKGGGDASIAKYDGEWSIESLLKDALTGDLGLVLKSKAKHAAVASKLKKPFKFEDKMLIVQYEIAFQNGQDCGGGYIKLLSDSPGMDLRQFTDKTPYTIMFGPDKCGSDSKFHFIFRHQNPLNQVIEEKHCKKVEGRTRSNFEDLFKDKKPHLLRLLIRPDNTFEMSIDQVLVNHGTLLDSFTPSVNPPAEIDDPEDRMPANWDEREKIADPEAVKPDDWDESAPKFILDETATKPEGWLTDEPDMIPDSEAEKPDDWDAEMDGEWEAPLIENPICKEAPGCGVWNRPQIENPKYKGKWYPEMINNPNYQGKWKPRKISNPDYFNDETPFKMTPIGAVGIELWSMSDSIYFDNLLITDNLALANAYATETYDLKMSKIDVASGGMFKRILDYSNKNPWLYAVYVVLVGLPLVLIITFCCSGSAEKKGKSALNDPKKTDSVQEDDQANEEEQDEDPEDEQEAEEVKEKSEGEEDDEEEEDEEEEEAAEDEGGAGEKRETRSSARKRRPRKD